MSETVSADTALERGRYALHAPPDGSYVVARSVDLCERCRNCGCGTPAEPLIAPAALMKMAPMFAKLTEGGSGGLARLKALLGRGPDDGSDT